MSGIGVVYTNWRQLLLLAREASDRAGAAVAAEPMIATADAIVAIVMAAAATECFINEFAEVATMSTEEGQPSLRLMADAVLKVEADNGPVQQKFLGALFALSGEKVDKGAQPWQDFAFLIRLRNALMHLRPLDRIDDDGQTVGPTFLETFERGGRTYPVPPGLGASWTLKISTDRMAEWAYRAALAIIRAVVELAPRTPAVETLFVWPMHNL